MLIRPIRSMRAAWQAVLRAACVCAVTAVLIGGCAAPQSNALRAQPASVPTRAQLLTNVPFFAQDAYQCGPAALAMVLRTQGREVTPQQLVAQVYLPAREGSLQAEMLATARRHGLLAIELPARLDALLVEVAAGRPVIVLQNLALPIYPKWHYAVVIGYDLDAGDLILHSGLTERQRLAMDVFEHTWARSGYWAMLVTAPERLPATLDSERLLAAATALERVSPAAARRAYTALTERSILDFGAWFGLGNTAAAEADYAAARVAFTYATELRPDSADAWNNLALMLLRDGQRDAAVDAARRAVVLGGPRVDRYRETLARVQRAPR
jgi:tetratricopeptide (TPR) repeat protein